ncbi:hypothetical protein FRB94_009240 [Tulasnella sp. JGI-2019a]|nr:hypothetical protein FRB94_009240 [Tulasnella sp. JGI-2019a]KAG9030560.1 hypothetical protein FRB95_003821 [Tulasnella sp. JGI-2019a]
MPPKRVVQPQQQPSTPPETVPEELSPNVKYLRTQSKWAAVCQYITTFMPAIGVSDYTVQMLEDDLADSSFTILPKLMHKMLYTLTLDRRINTETWQIYLRKQHIKRNPDTNPLGSDDEPIEWVALPIESKLDVLHQVTEWPFGNPTRVRSLMNDDDNYATWRAEPIGLDVKKNAYWFIGGERLWIQRARNLPSRPKKPIPKKKAPRRTVDTSAASKKKRGRPAKPPSPTPEPDDEREPPVRRSKRAAAVEASSPSKRSKVVGTRVSTRIRGRELEDEWQPIPEEWLEGSSPTPSDEGRRGKRSNGTSRKSTGLDDGSDSDLTELSDAEPEEPEERSEEVKPDSEQADAEAEAPKPEEPGVEEAPWPPPDDPNLVEWETICVTLDDWHQVTERFKGSTSMYEKALYKRLTQDIIPWVTEVWEERERERQRQLRALRQVEEVVGRKRSTRLAVLQSQKECENAGAAGKVEAGVKMDRAQRMEHRERLQAEDRERREREREERRREREIEEEEEEAKAKAEAEAEVLAKSIAEGRAVTQNGVGHGANGSATRRVRRTKTAPTAATATSRTASPADDWELACEICHKKGWNVDDGKVITACESCGKWQHTECHDQADQRIGRPKRNWDAVEFFCKSCQRKQGRSRTTITHGYSQPQITSSKALANPTPPPHLIPQTANGQHTYIPNGSAHVSYNQYSYAPGYYVPPTNPPVQYGQMVNGESSTAPAQKPYAQTAQYPPHYTTYAPPQQPQPQVQPQHPPAPVSSEYHHQNGQLSNSVHSAPAPVVNQQYSATYQQQPMVSGTPSAYSPYQSTQNGRPYIASGYAPAPQPVNGVQHQQRPWPGQAYGYGGGIPANHAPPVTSAPVATTYAGYAAPSAPNGSQYTNARVGAVQSTPYHQNSPYMAAQMLAYQAHSVNGASQQQPAPLVGAPPPVTASAGYGMYGRPPA